MSYICYQRAELVQNLAILTKFICTTEVQFLIDAGELWQMDKVNLAHLWYDLAK